MTGATDEERFTPATIDVRRDSGVTITYHDGYVAGFDLLELRDGCPCATCRGYRDAGDVVYPRPNSPSPLRIRDAEIHGGWGLNITWNDGHATGIFPFEALRAWHEGTS